MNTKKYTKDDIQIVPVLPSIVKNSKMYIGIDHKDFSYDEVCYKLLERTLVTTAVLCEAMPFVTDCCDGLYVISSDKNWFVDDGVSEAKELFFKLIGVGHPVVQFGFRMEVVLNALANNVLLVDGSAPIIIKGEVKEEVLQGIVNKYPNKYLIAFS